MWDMSHYDKMSLAGKCQNGEHAAPNAFITALSATGLVLMRPPALGSGSN